MDIKKILLTQLLPPSYAEKDEANNILSGLLQALKDGSDIDIAIVEDPESYINPETCPLSVLPWIAAWFNFDLEYWSLLFDWNEAKQRFIVANIGYWLRYKSSKKGIVWFIENFITNASVESIYEPITDVFWADSSLTDQNKFTVDHNYYRECTVHIFCNNVDDRVNILLRWLLDPRVKYYVTIINNYIDVTEWTPGLYFNKVSVHAYEDNPDTAFYADKSKADYDDRVDGKPWKYLLGKMQLKAITGDEWWPRMDSMWTIDDLSITTEIELDAIQADKDIIDGNKVADGKRYLQHESPSMGEKWWNIGTVEKIQQVGD